MPLSWYQTMAANPYEKPRSPTPPLRRLGGARSGAGSAGRAGRWQVQRVAVSRVWHFTGKCRLERASAKAASHTDSAGITQAGEAAAAASGVHTGAPWSAAIIEGALGRLGAKHEGQ